MIVDAMSFWNTLVTWERDHAAESAPAEWGFDPGATLGDLIQDVRWADREGVAFGRLLEFRQDERALLVMLTALRYLQRRYLPRDLVDEACLALASGLLAAPLSDATARGARGCVSQTRHEINRTQQRLGAREHPVGLMPLPVPSAVAWDDVVGDAAVVRTTAARLVAASGSYRGRTLARMALA